MWQLWHFVGGNLQLLRNCAATFWPPSILEQFFCFLHQHRTNFVWAFCVSSIFRTGRCTLYLRSSLCHQIFDVHCSLWRGIYLFHVISFQCQSHVVSCLVNVNAKYKAANKSLRCSLLRSLARVPSCYVWSMSCYVQWLSMSCLRADYGTGSMLSCHGMLCHIVSFHVTSMYLILEVQSMVLVLCCHVMACFVELCLFMSYRWMYLILVVQSMEESLALVLPTLELSSRKLDCLPRVLE